MGVQVSWTNASTTMATASSWPRQHRYSQVAQGCNSSRRPNSHSCQDASPHQLMSIRGDDRISESASEMAFYFTTCTLRTTYVVRGGYVHVLAVSRSHQILRRSSINVRGSYRNSLPRGWWKRQMSIRQVFPVVCPRRCLEVKFAVGDAVVCRRHAVLPSLAALALTTIGWETYPTEACLLMIEA
jgi:hypothetical protein